MPSHHHHPRGGGGLRPLVQVYLAKFVLEVLGGGGAIWGPAETFSFRTNDTTEFWQSIARLVSVLFAIRWVLQLGQELCAANRATCSDNNNNNTKTIVSFVHTLVTRFVLQVLGAIGAVWGFFECLTLRTDETQEFWRQVCFGVGVLFGGRFLSHMYQYWQDLNRKATTTTVHRVVEVTDTPQLVSLFAAKLVLEVFGAVGAIWGFSDFMGWRTVDDEAEHLWRFLALTVGLVFLTRYLCQLDDQWAALVQLEEAPPRTPPPPSPAGLQLKETWSFGSDTPTADSEEEEEEEEDSMVDELTCLLASSV